MIRHLALLLSTAGALHADWLQFRGPDGSGVATADARPPATVSPASIAWKVALPGRGLSSPLVIGDRIFLTAASGPRQQTLHLLCYSTTDGRSLWSREFSATGRTLCHDKTCNAAPSSASDGKVIVSLFSSNDLVCTDTSGRLLWLRGLMLDYPNASNSLGMSSSLILSGNTVVVQSENDSDSFTLGIDLTTGENQWRRAGEKNANWTSPSLLRSRQGTLEHQGRRQQHTVRRRRPWLPRDTWWRHRRLQRAGYHATCPGLEVPSAQCRHVQPRHSG